MDPSMSAAGEHPGTSGARWVTSPPGRPRSTVIERCATWCR